MGNKLAFLFFFLSFLNFFSLNLASAQTTSCTNGGRWNGTACVSEEEISDPRKIACEEDQNGVWIEALQKCECREGFTPFGGRGQESVCMENLKAEKTEVLEDNACPGYAVGFSKDGEEWCRCATGFTIVGPQNGRTEITKSLAKLFDGTGVDKQKCAKANETTENSLSCIKDLEDRIDACSKKAEVTMFTCSDKEESNAKIKGTVNGLSSQISGALGGGADGCSKAGLLSSTAGYGMGMINQNCDAEVKECKQACPDDLKQFSDARNIQRECKTLVPEAEKAQFIKHTEELAKKVEIAFEDCASDGETAASRFLKSTVDAAGNYVVASKKASAICGQISGKAELPINIDCVLSGGGPGCPVNCISNPDASCKVLNGTGVSTLAALPINGKTAIGNVVGNLKNAKGDLGGLDLSGVSGDAIPSGLPQAVDSSSNTFGAAAAAQAGGGGGTSEGGGKDKDKNSESTEEKSFFSGTFGAMKNAISSAFGGGRSGSSNKNSTTENMKRLEQLNSKNSIIRGPTNTGSAACYVDSVGARFCLGRKNKSIFDMMSAQYGNQNPTFIKNGG